MDTEDVVLAERGLKSHRWRILRETEPNKKKKGRAVMDPMAQLLDRQVIGVLDVSQMDDEGREAVTARSFETEWDRYCQQKLREEEAKQAQMEEDIDEPMLRLNFQHDQ